MKINDCRVFNEVIAGKFVHEIRLRTEFEEKLAGLMLDKNQTVS